jgi:hypothetical protein
MSWISIKNNPPAVTKNEDGRLYSERVLIKVEGHVYIGKRILHFIGDVAQWDIEGDYTFAYNAQTATPDEWQPLPI